VELEIPMDVVLSGDVPQSVVSVAVTMDVDATAVKSVEATGKAAGPQFVFSSPDFLDTNRGNEGRCLSSFHCVWFLSLILLRLAVLCTRSVT